MNVQYICFMLYSLLKTHLILSLVFSVIRVPQVNKMMRDRQANRDLPDGTKDESKTWLDEAIANNNRLYNIIGDKAIVLIYLMMFVGILINYFFRFGYFKWLYRGLTGKKKPK